MEDIRKMSEDLSKPPTTEELMLIEWKKIEHNTRMANNFLYKILEKLESLDRKVK
jgi:hypothetical protein